MTVFDPDVMSRDPLWCEVVLVRRKALQRIFGSRADSIMAMAEDDTLTVGAAELRLLMVEIARLVQRGECVEQARAIVREP